MNGEPNSHYYSTLQAAFAPGEVTIERVPVDAPVGTVCADAHWEGDTLVVPVIEEVVVVERRWVVREEVRITPRHRTAEATRDAPS